MVEDADHFRGLTISLDNRGGEALPKEVSLCPGARVYSFVLSARSSANPIPDTLATLRLQDSELILPSYGCAVAEIAGSLPGLAWPAFAKLVAAAGSVVTLHLVYGQCA